MQDMSVQSLLLPLLLAIAINLLWRYLQPVSGQTIWSLSITSTSGSAVGVFAGLLLGGTEMANNFYWTYVALPLIAAALTTGLQALLVDCTAQHTQTQQNPICPYFPPAASTPTP